MAIRPLLLLVPSSAACVEIPRRLASTGRAVAGIFPFTLRGLAETVAAPALLSQHRVVWTATHAALAAEGLLDACPRLLPSPDLPRGPVARALARTLDALRRADVPHARVAALAADRRFPAEDHLRLAAIADAYGRLCGTVLRRFADRAAVIEAALARLDELDWLRDAEVLVVGDLDPDAAERRLLDALLRKWPVRRVAESLPAALASGSFDGWARANGLRAVDMIETPLSPLCVPGATLPAGLVRLRAQLFEPPEGEAALDDAVELVTAPGEAAEVRAIARRLLREAARGVLFDEMAVLLANAEHYAPLATDLFARVGIPFRLHPAPSLRHGQAARGLMLLLACRGLARPAIMEFLVVAPVPFDELLGHAAAAHPSRWEAISCEAGVVSGLERWILGLRAYAERQRETAAREQPPERQRVALTSADDADALLRIVELLSATLDMLSGDADWVDWSRRLGTVFEQWLAPGQDRRDVAEWEAVRNALADLAGLSAIEPLASAARVEQVLATRLAGERLPVEQLSTAAVQIGGFDALAGLSFRVVAIPGLAEGAYPAVLRPDPFLLDAEREALAEPGTTQRQERRAGGRQLSLFPDVTESAASAAAAAAMPLLPTMQDRLLAERRAFYHAVCQASERLVLCFPRSDERTGRERLPSLFFVAAASALSGRTLVAAELQRLTAEDTADSISLDLAVDRAERDRLRLRRGGAAAEAAIRAGCVFFDQARRATHARWSERLTPYDGLLAGMDESVGRRLDPTRNAQPMSASRLASFVRCGFLYLLRHVLHLDVVAEPSERWRLDPLERGDLFHRVAERFLRERRERGELPLSERPETLARLQALADIALEEFVASQPPRLMILWERARSRFQEDLARWLQRETVAEAQAVPLHFEVTFGSSRAPDTNEPHLREPLSIDLADGRALRVQGRIDRIDRRTDGALILRDYKTGKIPRDDGQLFRSGAQMQMPFYILAAARLFPGQRVAAAYLDFVDGGREVAVDPLAVSGDSFRRFVRDLVDAMTEGLFVQDASACSRCDFVEVCGPTALIDRRYQLKSRDPRLQRVRRLRETL